MEFDAPPRGEPLVNHVLIERVDETIAFGDCPVVPRFDAGGRPKLAASRKLACDRAQGMRPHD
jgi:hypothetical protein